MYKVLSTEPKGGLLYAVPLLLGMGYNMQQFVFTLEGIFLHNLFNLKLMREGRKEKRLSRSEDLMFNMVTTVMTLYCIIEICKESRTCMLLMKYIVMGVLVRWGGILTMYALC